jgi:hypothetical protein
MRQGIVAVPKIVLPAMAVLPEIGDRPSLSSRSDAMDLCIFCTVGGVARIYIESLRAG